jgi:uncharacterized protein
MDSSTMIYGQLLAYIKKQYLLDWDGIHGVGHWTRVWRTGMLLTPLTGANQRVVELFAFLHDACRRDDKGDRHHGARSARLAAKINAEYLHLEKHKLELLDRACRYHDRGMTTIEPTIGTCWDADRLDLGRIDAYPEKSYLSTEAAKNDEFIQWCWRLSKENKP